MYDISAKSRRKETTRKWGDNIKMDLGEIGWGDIAWIDMA
jgi:hypothetical protein